LNFTIYIDLRYTAKTIKLKYFKGTPSIMVRLSKKTIQLLKDDIISILYDRSLEALFTNEIAREIRRDNEFTKKLLLELKKESLIEQVKKNKKGQEYLTHTKWRIPFKVLKAFNDKQ